MISQTALDDLNDLRDAGLNPTIEDIIRLNALGLVMEAAKKKNPASALDYLPRIAMISPTLAFRQPSIGHEVWLAKVVRMAAPDYDTLLAIRAFALSRAAGDLPDPEDPKSITAAIESFANECAEFTRDQIFAAIDYVWYGASSVIGEYPVKPESDPDEERIPDGTEYEDWKECIALGVLHEGRIALWGMNQREVESMTRAQLEDAISRSYIYHHIVATDEFVERRNKYYATLESIRERLAKEVKK